MSTLIQQLRFLYAKDIRPVFLIDDIDLVLQQLQDRAKKDNGDYPFKPEIVVQLRAWRSSAAFIICTENKLADIDSRASSNLFGLFDPVYLEGLNDLVGARKLLNEPIVEIPGATCFPDKDIDFLINQAGSHPYLLILGGKLLWEVRDRYGLLNKNESPEIQTSRISLRKNCMKRRKTLRNILDQALQNRAMATY